MANFRDLQSLAKEKAPESDPSELANALQELFLRPKQVVNGGKYNEIRSDHKNYQAFVDMGLVDESAMLDYLNGRAEEIFQGLVVHGYYRNRSSPTHR